MNFDGGVPFCFRVIQFSFSRQQQPIYDGYRTDSSIHAIIHDENGQMKCPVFFISQPGIRNGNELTRGHREKVHSSPDPPPTIKREGIKPKERTKGQETTEMDNHPLLPWLR